jgi:hypothetical protein
MSNHTESDLRFLRRVVSGWDADDGARYLDAYLAGRAKLPDYMVESGYLDGYSMEEIREAVVEARAQALTHHIVTYDTTINDWLEIARDFYQDATGSSRRPQLLADEYLEYLRLVDKYGGTTDIHEHPEVFLNAVWRLGKDPDVDHARFNSLPWDEAWGWPRYWSGATRQWVMEAEQKEVDRGDVKPFITGIISPEAREDHDHSRAAEPEPTSVPSPNCRARCHVRKPFAIYDFAAALSAHHGGECWLSREVASKWCSDMDERTVRKYINWLVDNGWFVELKKPRPGVGGAGRYRVVSHGDWIKAHGDTTCVRVPAERDNK